MSKSKSYNRIVFLTTLSLYLGLVLVGGTAPVLAHSATTKSFDIHNEIELSDDLDKKPDDSENSFPELFAQLLNEIKAETKNGKIQFPLPPNFHFESDSSYSGRDNTFFTISEPKTDKYLENTVLENFVSNFKPKIFEVAGRPGSSIKNIKISLQANSADLLLKVSFNKSDSAQFAEFLNQKYASSAKTVEDKLLEQVYENTTASSENNQVFIVTRLPRAAIDEFLVRK